MSEKSTIKDEKKGTEKKTSFLKGIFSGSWLTSEYIRKQRWYMLMVFCLALVYISYRYNIEQTMRKSRILEAEVKLLNSEYVTKSAELMRLSKRSEVLKLVREKNLNLVESQVPPQRIKAK